MSHLLEDLLALVHRDLGADDVRVLEPQAAAADAVAALRCELPDGRVMVVDYTIPPPDAAALQRRLEMVIESFRDAFVDGPASAATRSPPPRSLHDELAALAERSGARDAIVIDAHSPVVWGSALDEHDLDEESAAHESAPLIEPDRTGEVPGLVMLQAGPDGEAGPMSLAARAAAAVRALPEMDTLPKGGHVNAILSEPDFGYVARSFAAIYMLVLVFDGPIEELRAKRALLQALPTIERLVLALPPFDPGPPVAGQMAMRRQVRRRR